MREMKLTFKPVKIKMRTQVQPQEQTKQPSNPARYNLVDESAFRIHSRETNQTNQHDSRRNYKSRFVVDD